MSLLAAHHLPATLRVRPSAPHAPGQWFLDSDDRLVVANAGESSMHFVFTGPIRLDLVND